MIATTERTSLLSYPARPVNGGKLEYAPAKVGLWAWQPKIDDWRAVIHTPTRRVWNRHGEPSTVAQQGKLEVALDHLSGLSFAAEWLDVGIMENRHDMMRGSVVVFDVMEGGSYSTRRTKLESMFQTLPLASQLLGDSGQYRDGVFLIEHYVNADPLALYRALQAENAKLTAKFRRPLKFYEGLVAKKMDASYPLQMRSPKFETHTMQKHRFDI